MPTVAKPPGQKRGHPNKSVEASTLVTTDTVDPNLPAPAHLSEIGQSVWGHVLQSANSWLQESDLPVLLLLCEGYERRADYIKDIKQRGAVLEERRFQGQNEYTFTTANPAVAMLEKVEVQITKWLSLLGLSPSDRGRLGVQYLNAETTLERLRKSRDGSPEQTDSYSPSTSPPSQSPPSSPGTGPE